MKYGCGVDGPCKQSQAMESNPRESNPRESHPVTEKRLSAARDKEWLNKKSLC